MKQKRCSHNNTAGFTLIELLIAMVVFAIIVTAMYAVLINSNRNYAIQNEVVDAQNNLRAAVGLLTRELRMAGYESAIAFQNLSTEPLAGDRLEFFIEDTLINYYLDAGGNIRRNDQVIAENIIEFAFIFTEIASGKVTFNVTADTATGDRDRSASVTVLVRNM